ncbi:MAG: helicase-related protein [Alloprevotella sp.]|nr:helicase-related protein [Alloprevotella sp.]
MEEHVLNPHIFTNQGGNTLIREFEGVLQHNAQIKNLDAVVGFLRASGYFSLRPFLDNISRVRVLIGIDVDKYIVQAASRGRLFFGAEESVKEDCLRMLRKDIEASHYQKDIEDGIFQMVQDLLYGKLELRAHPSKKIHAKLYILYPDNFNQYTGGMAITGSSNLSGNGLGISSERQYEFNVKMDRYDDIKFSKDEFERLWKEAEGCEITADDVKQTIELTYLQGDVSPYDLYVKMLMEHFADRVLETDRDDPFDMPEGYARYDYQMDAVVEGYQKLIRYDGFFLADVVGLGKTVIATMIAKKFLLENGRDNTKILVVYPPAVEQNWKTTFKDFGIDKYANFITNGSLSKVLDEDNYNYWNAAEFDLILVDEAHKFRSHTTAAFAQLQEICKMPRLTKGNIPGYKKKVMLISATPMNNTPADIYNELQLFQDTRRPTIDGVGNLSAYFPKLIKEFKRLKREKAMTEEFKKLAEKVRKRIIKPLTVRRTRTDIESVPRYSNDINGFPKVERPIESRYEMTPHLANLFEQAMNTLTMGQLSYARYRAIEYLKPEKAEGLYEQAELVSRSLSNIRKNGLVKRLESSFYAFQVSLENFRQANQNMIDMFNNNKVFIAPDLDINLLLESGLSDEEIEEKLNAKAEVNPKNAVFEAQDFRDEFIGNLLKDQELLEQMVADWRDISDADDSKFAKFNDLLKHELFKISRNPEQKLVVFSESLDTVEYLKRRINRPDVLVISSKNRKEQFKTIRENFDANYPNKQNDYNIILTTDVLAEGVNLHRANVIVNYDTPWNATRLMQRIGRVNRIGSASKHIYNYVFYPSREGNCVINLNHIVLSKIQTFHSTFGEDNQIYSGEEILDRNLSKLFDEAVQAQKEDFNKEIPFYEELRELYQTNRREYNRIANLSLRSRTGRASREVDGVTLSGDTLVFLKTNFRKVFFLVSEHAKPISTLEALNYFKAAKDEPSVGRIDAHHQHVKMALEKFRQLQDEEIHSQESSGDVHTSMGAQMNMALNLLTHFMREIEDNDLYQKVAALKKLAERGVITQIAKRLQRIQKDLGSTSKKSRMTRNEAFEEIIAMANKYAPYYVAEESMQNEHETNAEVILSESFQP